MENGDRKEGTTRQPCPSRPSSLAWELITKIGKGNDSPEECRTVPLSCTGEMQTKLGHSSAESALVKLGKALVPIRSGRSNSCGVGLTPR